jgi:O-antigen/teichoic acid export membrane protein
MITDSSSIAKGAVVASSPTPAEPAAGLSTEAIDPNAVHFATDHLLTDLKGRTISSGAVTIVAQGIWFVLNLGSTMVLARLLLPQDFGLIAMVTTVMGFLHVLKEAGLSTATVQREGITHAQVSNLFWVNVAVGGFTSLLVAASAPALAWFYRDPRLVWITVALSGTFLLTGLAVQHSALLNRQMRFKAIAVIQIGSMAVGVAVGIGMAWLKYGYWSLVWSNLSMAIAALVLTWIASPWKPQAPTRNCETRSLISFGAHLTAGSFLYALSRGIDSLLIGRFYGPSSIGLYSRAAALFVRPLEHFMNPIQAVFVPALSRLQGQPERYRRSFLRLYESIALVGFLFAGIALPLARPLTLVVFGSKWEKVAIIFAGFTIGTLTYPLTSATSWLFVSQGRGKESFHATAIGSLIVVLAIVAGLPFGPAGVAIACSMTGIVIGLPIYYYMAGSRGPVTTADLWIGFLRYLPLWALTCGATWVMLLCVGNFAPWAQLIICAPVGLLAGLILVCILTPMRRVALGLVDVLRELKARRGSSSTK